MPQSVAGKAVREAIQGKELALLDRIRRGDRGAFSELYRLYHPRLCGYLRRLLPNPATVEEVLDDVMLVVWKDARKFRGEAAVSSWILGIAYRKALTAMRTDRRYQAPLDHSADASALAAVSSPHDEWIRAALMRLSTDHRQGLLVTQVDGPCWPALNQCPSRGDSRNNEVSFGEQRLPE